jgi:predicted 3-demethylubiquinone-9 3-methyltransferase (glyoxalase superfamily)
MPRITPFLWFDTQAEEAAQFYTSIFKNSKIRRVLRYPEGSPGPVGRVMTVDFELDGQEFTALNAGSTFKFNEAISFVVHCHNQEEVDRYWNGLLEGGTESQCGWLKDKFGVSWQITPDVLIEMLQDKDSEKSKRVMQAMLGMKKIDIEALKLAYDEQ